MVKKEVSEIKKKLRDCLRRISVCYVNADKEIVASYTKHIGALSDEQVDHYTVNLKKCFSGIRFSILP